MYNEEIDKKWQKKWEEDDIYRFEKDSKKPKFYALEMFSYPSSSKLHMGHCFNYQVSDTFVRFKKMDGFNIFHPMGFDSFGLPAENFAIKSGIHPKDSTEANIKNMEIQLRRLGLSCDWNYEVITSREIYYKFTQWIFSLLYKNNLAYKKMAAVNFCPSCNTVLANEQVIDSKCERCNSIIQRKKLSQWFFRITKYAEELLSGLETLDWPNLTKKIQKNWIGKSEGTYVNFKMEKSNIVENDTLVVFTTRVDTIFGVSFISIAPDSQNAMDIVDNIQDEEIKKKCIEYIENTKKVSELERQFSDREKTGVFTGFFAINPVNNKKVPIFLADYVLENYATGVVMGVPAHDKRDFDFSKKMGLERIYVLKRKDDKEKEENKDLCIEDKQNLVLINSGIFDGLDNIEAKKKIQEYLEKNNSGKKITIYKLKDWLVSRQRYWGAPIPIIYCKDCGEVLDENLPVKLPYNVEFLPNGKSPLSKCEEFIHTKCPKCGKDAKREVDTLDTFVCSSWYYLRYPNNLLEDKAFDIDTVNKLMPVDLYVGGKEHAAMHLIYARFIFKVLRDLGYVKYDEPFKKLLHQGLILGPDGLKMSKSKGNTVSPDDYITKYGSDTLRMYLMFAFDYTEGGPWSDEGINSMSKYISRLELVFNKLIDKKNIKENEKSVVDTKDIKKLDYILNSSIKQIRRDIENQGYNTCIAKIMECTNEFVRLEQIYGYNEEIIKRLKIFVKMIAPFMPYLSQEMWSKLNNTTYLYNEEYPKVDEDKLVLDTKKIVIQINGKLKSLIEVDRNMKKDEIIDLAKKDSRIERELQKNELLKTIYVENKLINFVVKK